jgi:hypothetical protein
MTTDQGVKRRLMTLAPLQLVILAIGAKYVLEDGVIPHLAGWALVIGSLLTLIGYALAIWRPR